MRISEVLNLDDNLLAMTSTILIMNFMFGNTVEPVKSRVQAGVES